MEKLKKIKKKAVLQYEDLRDTITVIESMKIQGAKPGVSWGALKNKLRARHN